MPACSAGDPGRTPATTAQGREARGSRDRDGRVAFFFWGLLLEEEVGGEVGYSYMPVRALNRGGCSSAAGGQ
jgi:hypothetical protein